MMWSICQCCLTGAMVWSMCKWCLTGVMVWSMCQCCLTGVMVWSMCQCCLTGVHNVNIYHSLDIRLAVHLRFVRQNQQCLVFLYRLMMDGVVKSHGG